MRRRLAAVVAVALLVSCGGDGGDGGEGAEEAAPSTTAEPGTTTSSSTTTTAPEPPDPFSIPEDPADIDEAYVEAVINEHNRVIGDALRIQLQGGDPQEVIDRYNAIYVAPTADLLLTDVLSRSNEELGRFKRPPGTPSVDVTVVEVVSTDCVAAELVQDTAALVEDAPAPFEAVTILRRRSDPVVASDLNRTSWLSEGLSDRGVSDGERCGD